MTFDVALRDNGAQPFDVALSTPGVDGVASGSLALTGGAVGAAFVAGIAAGLLSLAGAAAGAVVVSGAAAGTLAIEGAAQGLVATAGAASGTIALTGSAGGAVSVDGAASGTIALTGSAGGAVYAAPPTAVSALAVWAAQTTAVTMAAEPATALAWTAPATWATFGALATRAECTALATTAEVTLGTVTIGEGDTLPVLTATLSAGGTPVNLTGASVQLRLRLAAGGTLAKNAVLVTPADGIVSVTFAANDLPSGRHRAQFVVTYGSGDIQSFPNTGEPLWLAVAERL